jgi:hypothetical protein
METVSDDKVRWTHEPWRDDANHTLRMLLLINGGAPIAVLAFICALPKDAQIDGLKLTTITTSIVWFACGAASAIVAMGVCYLTCILVESGGQQALPRSQKWHTPAVFFQVATVAVAFTSLGLFLVGMIKVRLSIAGFT